LQKGSTGFVTRRPHLANYVDEACSTSPYYGLSSGSRSLSELLLAEILFYFWFIPVWIILEFVALICWEGFLPVSS
ncbi:hypothetical protein V1506DRAFT_560445, partial [Lipomyces tetrasporus]